MHFRLARMGEVTFRLPTLFKFEDAAIGMRGNIGMSDIINVVASVFNPNDRDSQGHNSRPTLHTYHHIQTGNTLSHDSVAPAATSRAMTHDVGQELA